MNKKPKPGKKLEKLMGMIQESLKDSPHTTIHSNYRIPNVSGRKREIDVFIESKINSITIKIAIECKDYKGAISVDKMEAFITKCNRIPDINKKIFVSKNGYQADAINAAQEYNIDLYSIKDLNQSTIRDWIPPITQLGLKFILNPTTIHINSDDLTENLKSKDDLFHFYLGNPSEQRVKFINGLLLKEVNIIWAHTLTQYLNRKATEPEKKVNMPFDLKLNGVFILDENGKKIPVLGVSSTIDAWLEEKNLKIEEANSLVDSSGEVKANNIAIPFGGKEKANVILTKDKLSIFHTDENGLTQELKHFTTFTPDKSSKKE